MLRWPWRGTIKSLPSKRQDNKFAGRICDRVVPSQSFVTRVAIFSVWPHRPRIQTIPWWGISKSTAEPRKVYQGKDSFFLVCRSFWAMATIRCLFGSVCRVWIPKDIWIAVSGCWVFFLTFEGPPALSLYSLILTWIARPWGFTWWFPTISQAKTWNHPIVTTWKSVCFRFRVAQLKEKNPSIDCWTPFTLSSWTFTTKKWHVHTSSIFFCCLAAQKRSLFWLWNA